MSRESGDGLPTGKAPGVLNEVADPHPSTEEGYDDKSRPGGVKPDKVPDFGPNSYTHDGKAPPRPRNKGAGPE